jgi:hypothetical protein
MQKAAEIIETVVTAPGLISQNAPPFAAVSRGITADRTFERGKSTETAASRPHTEPRNVRKDRNSLTAVLPVF